MKILIAWKIKGNVDLKESIMNNAYWKKFEHVFGKKNALLFKLSGMKSSEIRGEGAWIYDDNEERFLDFGSYGIHLLGHRHPEIVDCATKQLKKMGLSTKILANEPSVAAAEALLDTLPESLRYVIYANSGSESVEFAIRSAMLSTGKKHFIALKNGYHGKTSGALSLTHYASGSVTNEDTALPVDHIPPDDSGLEIARGLFKGGTIAAFVMEPIQGEGGIRPVPEDFVFEMASLCKTHGAMFIMDEIQTGLGRCGQVWSPATMAGVPDIVLVGKTLGGGLVPIAMTVFRECGELLNNPTMAASSYASSPFACAVANRAIELVSQEDFLRDVREKGRQCLDRLNHELASREEIREIRGKGLMIGIEFTDKEILAETLMSAYGKGVLTTFCLTSPEVLRIYPPAVISDEDLQWGLDRLIDAVETRK
ncbi:MAG: aspartate aminotransferase family protein [Desulfobacterales bacterium]|nr:aspartate aminotransferase family protein [Desulfobacterales bacterium]